MKTWQEIANRVYEVEAMCDAWEKDNDMPTVEYKRQQVKAITKQIDSAWSDLHDFVCSGDAEENAYELVMAIDDWMDEVDRFRDDYTANPGGTEEVWKAWDRVQQLAIEEPVPVMLEAISTLAVLQKCSPLQIAKIYEWKDRFGQWDQGRVLQAIESNQDYPTTNPHWQRRRDKIKADWEARQNRERQQKTETPAPSKKFPKIAPESMETLLNQGVPSKQIARMKQVDQQTVIDYARELQIEVDGEIPAPMQTPRQALSDLRETENKALSNARKAKAEQKQKAQEKEEKGEINTYADLNNYREQVRQMAFDGCTKQQIVSNLKTQFPDKCKPGSVAQILSAMEREAAANQE